MQDIYDKAMSKLHTLFMEKILVVQSEEIQLKMLSEKLEWARTFIRFQEKNLKPLYYFQAQERYASIN